MPIISQIDVWYFSTVFRFIPQYFYRWIKRKTSFFFLSLINRYSIYVFQKSFVELVKRKNDDTNEYIRTREKKKANEVFVDVRKENDFFFFFERKTFFHRKRLGEKEQNWILPGLLRSIINKIDVVFLWYTFVQTLSVFLWKKILFTDQLQFLSEEIFDDQISRKNEFIYHWIALILISF